MFETLVVSRADVRPAGGTVTAALGFHLLVLVLAIGLRTEPAAPIASPSEPIRIAFSSVPRPVVTPSPAPRGLVVPAPMPSLGEVTIPALALAASGPAFARLDVSRMVAADDGAVTGPALSLAVTDAAQGLSDPAEADLPPRLETPIDPTYPPALRAAGIAGRTVVEYAVGVDGRVDSSSVRVIHTTHPDFVPPIRAALAAARFSPAQLGGRSIAARVRQQIVFQIR